MDGTFRVDVKKDYLSFSSAHFITFRGHKCEALHGHNYRMGVSVEGALDAEALFVLDFAVLKEVAKPMLDAIDHRVLLPGRNPRVTIAHDADRVLVTAFGESRYVFPARDVAVLPVSNTTAEMLAEHFATEIRSALDAQGVAHLTLIEIEVEESPGQSATYRLPLR
ncbi:MAG TPA: 6-carboxytetrahydropterin synthase [Gemmatimonadales bacterium]|nr:6-carboxytetrahydropterin synthase [Gemmatimonadales bacterium]